MTTKQKKAKESKNRVSERPYTDTYEWTGHLSYRIKRTYNFPGGREALIKRAIVWRGFDPLEAEQQYPEILEEYDNGRRIL